MKLYVQMSEEEYDFYKEYKKNKKLILDNFRKIFIHAFFKKKNYTKEDISILYSQLEKYLFSIIEVCDNTCETKGKNDYGI